MDGVAVHWYADGSFYPSLLSQTHDLFPDKFILYTEACEGWDAAPGERVVLGSWQRAQNYAYNIIDVRGLILSYYAYDVKEPDAQLLRL